MKLLIVESPNKKQTISKYLGPGWRVEASMGHVCDLPLKTLGILLPAYKPTYELTERGKKTIDRLKIAAKDVESVWLAMDPDREGEAIAGNIARYLKTVVSTFYRVVFNEITQKAIQAAVANPRKLNRPLYEAQQARRVIDRLVGYQVSPRLSRVTNQKLSAGRVQSVALRLLVDRERAIRAFAPTEHCGVRLNFKTEGIEWVAHWQTEPFVDEDNPYVLDKALAEQVARIKEVVVLSAS
ncbi:MAG TPA: DNA topoisomerase, partial [Gammaproteobacteria bacterium]|nr:DNA topoisomerase [Gammaproteobacteria bacterium]